MDCAFLDFPHYLYLVLHILVIEVLKKVLFGLNVQPRAL